MRGVAMLIALVVLAACGLGGSEATVIDGSSQEAFDRTFAEARRELGPQDRLKFEAAMAEYRAQTFARADDRAEYNRLLREGMDGLTAQRIVAEFDKGVTRVKGEAADKAFDIKRAVIKGDAGEASGKDGQ